MNPAVSTRSLRLQRNALGVAAIGAVAAIALVWLFPGGFGIAYRYALFGCLGPAVGSLIFALIHRMTGGRWGERLRPFFGAGITLLPWVWLLSVLALLMPPGMAEPWPAYMSH